LEGYRCSRPVRIGNDGTYTYSYLSRAAQGHLQLDIYGELMDAAYLYNKFGSPISYDLWCSLRRIVNFVCNNYDVSDMSIWETRGPKRAFVYSRVMCW
jgi:GH15 family glucan-1,4-alpha-glucosidase